MKRAIAVGVALVATVHDGRPQRRQQHPHLIRRGASGQQMHAMGKESAQPVRIENRLRGGRRSLRGPLQLQGDQSLILGNTYKFTFSANGRFAEPTD